MFAAVRKSAAVFFAAVLFALPSACGGGGSPSVNAPPSDSGDSGNNEIVRTVGLSANEMQTARAAGADEIRILQISEDAAASAAVVGAQDGASTVTLAVISIDAVSGDTFSFDVKIGENGEWVYRVIAVDDKGTPDTADDVEVAKSEIRVAVTTIPTTRADKILAVSREVLPDYASEFLQNDTQIRLAVSGDPTDGTTATLFSEIEELTFTHLPYSGADEINAESTTDLASHWWLFSEDTDIVPLNSHGSGEDMTYPVYNPQTGTFEDVAYATQITLGMVYRAGGDKFIIPVALRERDAIALPGTSSSVAAVTAVIAITLSHQGQAAVTAIFGGSDYGVTLADYDDKLSSTLASLFSENSEFAAGDDFDMLVFQNQYSAFGIWILPSIDFVGIPSNFGLTTPPARVPGSGTAIYKGIAAGKYDYNRKYDREAEEYLAQGAQYFTYGSAEFTADFGSGKVAGKITVSAYDWSQTEDALEGKGAFDSPRGTIGFEFSGEEIDGNGFGDYSNGPAGFLGGGGGGSAPAPRDGLIGEDQPVYSYSADNSADDLGVFARFKNENANEFADDVSASASGVFFGFNADEVTGEADLWVVEDDDGNDVEYSLDIGFTADKQ